MTTRPRPHDLSPEPTSAARLVARIRKLRWIGDDDEATMLQSELASRPGTVADCVLATPRETD